MEGTSLGLVDGVPDGLLEGIFEGTSLGFAEGAPEG